MIKTLVKQEYLYACDRCGATPNAHAETITEAREIAETIGFVITDWMHAGICPRQTAFCAKCVEEIGRTSGRIV